MVQLSNLLSYNTKRWISENAIKLGTQHEFAHEFETTAFMGLILR